MPEREPLTGERVTLDGLHALLGMLREDLRREAEKIEHRLSFLQRADETLANKVNELARRIDAIDSQSAKALETSLGAMRRAESSVHEIQSVGVGLMGHLAAMETHRTGETAETTQALASINEQLRSVGRAGDSREQRIVHRFDDHKAAIASLASREVRVPPRQLALLVFVISAAVASVQLMMNRDALAPSPVAPAPSAEWYFMVDGGRK